MVRLRGEPGEEYSLRVLHVINRFSQAGAETSLRELLSSTANHIEHGLVVLHADGNDLRVATEHGIEVFVPSSALSWRGRVAHVHGAIRRFAPELVHTTLFEADTAGRVAAHREGTPALTSLVNTPYAPGAIGARTASTWRYHATKAIDRTLSRRYTTHFHAISKAVAAEYVREFGLEEADVTVVPRGRSRERLGKPSADRRRRVRMKLNVPDEARVILTLGRQEPQKGHRHLLDAVAALPACDADVVVLFAGRQGASSGLLQRIRHERGLDPRKVRFLGFREDVGDLLAVADVFAFPSIYEGLGGSLLEAMAMDVPVVASDVPAIREVLADGSCGLLVPPADPVAISSAIHRLLSDDQLRDELVSAARERFESTYTVSKMIAGMTDLYTRLLR